MYDDTKSAIGIGPSLLGASSNSVTNLKNDFLSLASVLENTVLPKVRNLAQVLNETSQKAGNLLIADKSGRVVGSTSSQNRVAPAPPTAAGGAGVPPIDATSVAPNVGGSGGTPSSKAPASLRIAAGALTAMKGMDYLSTILPGVPTSVMQDFLTQRSSFFGQGGFTGDLNQQSRVVNSIQKMMARNGVAVNSMDTTKALAAAQTTGLSGANNFRELMGGVASASIFTPGMSQEQIAGAVGGSMNAPTTVNLAKTIGINIRDAQGNVMPPDKLADQIWGYITRYNGGKTLTKKQVQISLMPGNGLYGMLSGMFSNDPTMFTIISNMLVAKAQFGGQELGTITKDQAVTAGIMSATTRNISSQVSAQTNLLTATAAATAGGYAGAADIGTGMNNLAAAMSNLTTVLGGGNGFFQGIMGLSGGAMGKGIKGVLGTVASGAALKTGMNLMAGAGEAGLFARLLPALGKLAPLAALAFLEDGGPADKNKPYIVGEVGPELFIPKTDGVVLSNKDLNSMHRASGGGVSGFESEFFKDISAPNTAANRAILEQWMRYESGKDPMRWNNPMNSTLRMKGSESMNKVGVQKYLSVAQGAQADAATLLNTKGVGYENILSAFREGKDKDKIWSSIVQSGWVTGKADPNRTSYASGSGGSSGIYSSSSSASTASFNSSYATSKAQLQGLSGMIASAFGDQSSGGALSSPVSSQTYNYGGVNITIQAAKDPAATADAIKKALKDKTTVSSVGQR